MLIMAPTDSGGFMQDDKQDGNIGFFGSINRCVAVFLFWLALTSVDFHYIASGTICSIVAVYMMSSCRFGRDWRNPRNFVKLIKYIKFVFCAAFLSSMSVLKSVVKNVILNEKVDPFFHVVKIQGGRSQVYCYAVANAITVTPGTISAYVDGEFILVYCFSRDFEVQQSWIKGIA